VTRGEIWWADLGPYRTQEQTGRRPLIVWQSDTLTRVLQSVLVVPLTTNLDRAKLAGTPSLPHPMVACPPIPWPSRFRCARFQ
jgi:mRNA interferase MazF